jgi:cytochrome c oxidase cbb3-type subunit 3
MSSAFRTERARCAWPVAVLAATLSACSPSSNPAAHMPAVQQAGPPVVVSGLFPGGTSPPPEDPRGFIYDGNAAYIADGKQYFTWYNCSGCHFNGGGGIGPSFMDKVWRYGGRIDQIHNSIAEGRPNGMPTWRDKIPDSQIWEIAAYVRSLSPPRVQTEQTATAPPPPTQPPATPNHQGGTTVTPGAQ